RKKAVDSLNLSEGDTVVEIACGTGLNFPRLQQFVGPGGKIIGVDLTDNMLAQAGRRVERNGWSNVELVQSDAGSYTFPHGIGGVISTFALTLIPDYDQVIRKGAEALVPGKRLVILDLKLASGAPLWLVKIGVFFSSPFGVTLEMAERHPWESVDGYLKDTSVEEMYFGFVYMAKGEA
ncbi:MAG: class I SAM-dependent methyltransferase, partial [Fidelibacterota bacterium]